MVSCGSSHEIDSDKGHLISEFNKGKVFNLMETTKKLFFKADPTKEISAKKAYSMEKLRDLK